MDQYYTDFNGSNRDAGYRTPPMSVHGDRDGYNSGPPSQRSVSSSQGRREYSSPNPLLAAKNARRRAENDALLLENRLRRLKVEEERAKRKIEETRKRASEILSLKERNETRNRVKMQAQDFMEAERRREQQLISMHNAERRAARRALQDSILETRRAEVATQKRLSKDNDLAMNRFRDMEKRRAQIIRDSIKTHELEALSRQQKQREMHENILGRDFEDRVMSEEERRRNAEEEVMRMEREESELIERLRVMQQKQKKAYEELEDALATTYSAALDYDAQGSL